MGLAPLSGRARNSVWGGSDPGAWVGEVEATGGVVGFFAGAARSRLVEFGKTVRVGDPFDPDVALGPLISQKQLDRVLVRAEIVAMACAPPADSGAPLARWSSPEIARDLAARCQVEVSASSVAEDARKPWQYRSWISIRTRCRCHPSLPPGQARARYNPIATPYA